ncbi:uncharacterized protein [Diadema antillarum]|uniref:uncharacterized protein n=1 Tax=Diadema antillarum TaxID=105358 RepID=UPI003A8B0089
MGYLDIFSGIRLFGFILALLVVQCGASSGPTTRKRWVAIAEHQKPSSTARDFINRVRRQAVELTPVPPEMVRFHAETRIAVRFASTTIRAYIRNPAGVTQKLSFDLLLPLNSYISDFAMTVDGVRYQGFAIDRCIVSDLSQPSDISISSIDMMEYTTGGQETRNLFTVTVNTIPRGNVQILVQYQELLERQGGWYTQRISIRPEQSVYDFRIFAAVTEPQGIVRAEAGIDTRSYTESVSTLLPYSMAELALSTAASTRGKVYDLDDQLRAIGSTKVRLDYRPTERKQNEYENRGDSEGIYGDFIIRYDIAHRPGVGEVQTEGVNFVHRFAPVTFDAVNKRVVFVLDFSASMYGNKIRQTKEAMNTILDEMSDRDFFNILPFSDYVYKDWQRDRMVQVNPHNVANAKEYIKRFKIKRGTNLNDALLDGFRLLETTGSMNSSTHNPMVCILFLLTDGKPSEGVTSLSAIERNAQRANNDRCSLVTLGFGRLVNYNFLVRLALQNRGMARRIYEDSSAAGQLRGVYNEVATPLLFNIVVEYLNNAVDLNSVSTLTFPNYFNGSELAITGQLTSDDLRYLPIKITAVGANGVITFQEDVNLRNPPSLNDENVPPNFVERTYAFLTMRELFDRYRLADDPMDRRAIAQRARELGRRYNLLTPLMNMVLSRVPTGTSGSTGGDSTVTVSRITETRPSGFEWTINGPLYGRVGEVAAGIGGAACALPLRQIQTTEAPTTTRRTTTTEAPATTTIRPTDPPDEEDGQDGIANPVILRRYYVESDTTERLARTRIEAEYENVDNRNHPIEFSQQVPSGAYISDFNVNVGGQIYRGIVQNIRDDRWRNVFATSTSGQVLAMLARRDPTKDAFVMRVPSVRPNIPVTFALTYDELLKRVRGQYEQRISVSPRQLVDNFGIDVLVTEPQRVEEMTASYQGDTSRGPQTVNLATGITREGPTRSRFQFFPTVYDQAFYSHRGINGDIVIKYDVRHTPAGSHTQVQGNHFVHFFSPSELNVLNKQIVFVIDVSASMYGTKLSQTKEALKTMLDNLNPRDYFSIITFSDGVRYWRANSRLAPANARYITEAKAFIDSLVDDSETNLNEAILKADELLDSEAVYNRPGDEYLSMIVLLTDGIPSVGVTDPQEILDNAREAIDGDHSLYTLGFGRLADFDLLVKLAFENDGIARMIYEDASAADQLRDFYYELYRPLLFDVTMKYPGDVANPESLTDRRFPVYFDGSELVVAGRLYDNPSSSNLRGVVDLTSTEGPGQKRWNTDIRRTSPELSYGRTVPNVVQRIWVLKRLEDLIRQYGKSTDHSQRSAIADRIITLARQHNLVTPLTPMTLSDPRTGEPLDGTSGRFPLPGYSMANSPRDLLKDAINSNGPTQPPVKIQDAPLAMENDVNVNMVRFDVSSVIVLRYAVTTIQVEMQNEGSSPGQAVFKQKIPEDAFISNLTIIVNGREYSSEVTNPQDTAGLGLGNLEIGRSGGILSPLGDLENNLLVLSVPVEPMERAYFRLTYEMLLPRRLGLYEQKIGVFPEQVVEVMNLRTIVIEPQGIAHLEPFLLDQSDPTSPIRLDRNILRRNTGRWEVGYSPRSREQMGVSPTGIMADYVVRYDVVHGNNAGYIEVLNDHFVQFFSPSGLSVLRKNIVFVIDLSGSMAGTKLAQVKDALSTILDDMSETDKFNILPFSDDVHYLDSEGMLYSTRDNVRRAKRFVRNLQEMDNTNLHKAIISGVRMLRAESETHAPDEEIVSMLIVLTDGNPNHGETDKAIIERNVHEAIGGDFSLFCLGFGADVDFPFLTRLALQNHGVARRIPERADARELLENFYLEVATPLLHDVEFRYSRGVMPNTLSERAFPNYFNGSELLVVGRLNPDLPYNTLNSYVYARTASDDVTLRSRGNIHIPSRFLLDDDVPDDVIKRIWAYHIIQTLRRQRALSEDTPEYSMVGEGEIRDKSVQHRFFNPYTALVFRRNGGHSSEVNPFALRLINSPLPRTARQSLARNLTVVSPPPAPVPSPLPAGFNIAVPRVEVTVCLDEDPQIDDVIRLLEDRLKGIYVNGRITGESGQFGHGLDRTFIGEIVVLLNRPQRTQHRLQFNPIGIDVDSVRQLRWGIPATYSFGANRLENTGRSVAVTLADGTSFEVVNERLAATSDGSRPHAFKFNVLDNRGLSSAVDGIIGRFQHTSIVLEQPSSQLSATAGSGAQGCNQPVTRSQAVTVTLTWRRNGSADANNVCDQLDDELLSNNLNLQYHDFRRSSLFTTV